MPSRQRLRGLRRKKRYVRRRVKKRGKRSKISIVNIRGPYLIADKYRCKLVATQTVLQTASATTVEFKFAANSLFDPFILTSTNQPLGFDQIMQLYGSYRVYASRLTFDYVNTSETVPMNLVMFPSNKVDSITFSNSVGLPYTKFRTVGTKDGEGVGRLSNYITTKAMLGDMTVKYDDLWIGTASVEVSELIFWRVRLETLGGSLGGNISFQGRFMMTLWAEFFDRITPPISQGSDAISGTPVEP